MSEHSGVVIRKGCPRLNLTKQLSITASWAGGPQSSASFLLGVEKIPITVPWASGSQSSASFLLGLESLHFLWKFFCLPCSGHSFPWISSSSHISTSPEKAHKVLCGSWWHQSTHSLRPLPGVPHSHAQSPVLYKRATARFLASCSWPSPGSQAQVLPFIFSFGGFN